jgi:hypothetical protein
VNNNDHDGTPRYDTPFQMPHSDLPPRVEGHRSGLWPVEPGSRQPPREGGTRALTYVLVLGAVLSGALGAIIIVVMAALAP